MRSSTLLTCSALFVAGSLAQYGQSYEEASLYARDAYPEPEAEPWAEADAYADNWELAEELRRREAGDDLDWAFNTRDIPQFDGHVSTRDLHGDEPRLARRAPQSQSLYNKDPEVEAQRQNSLKSGRQSPGFEGGSEDMQRAMQSHEAEKGTLKYQLQQHGAHLQNRVKQYQGHLDKFKTHMASAEGRQHVLDKAGEVRKGLSSAEGRQAYLHKASEKYIPASYREQASKYSKMAGEHVPASVKEGWSKYMGKPHEVPHPMVARRSLDGLDGEGEALMGQLERRAAYEGRAAHYMASQEFGDA